MIDYALDTYKRVYVLDSLGNEYEYENVKTYKYDNEFHVWHDKFHEMFNINELVVIMFEP